MAQSIDMKVTLDLPDGVEFLGYERVGDGHGIEVKFPLPDVCRCDACGRKEPATYEYKNTVYMVRHLDLFGQPCFLVYQPCFPLFAVRASAGAPRAAEAQARHLHVRLRGTRAAHAHRQQRRRRCATPRHLGRDR